MLLTILFLANISNASRKKKKKKYIPHPMHADQIEEVLASILYWMLRLYSIIKQGSRKTQKHHFSRPQCYTLWSCVNISGHCSAPVENIKSCTCKELAAACLQVPSTCISQMSWSSIHLSPVMCMHGPFPSGLLGSRMAAPTILTLPTYLRPFPQFCFWYLSIKRVAQDNERTFLSQIFMRYGRQRWKLKGKIEVNGKQSWDGEEMVFLPLIVGLISIKVCMLIPLPASKAEAKRLPLHAPSAKIQKQITQFFANASSLVFPTHLLEWNGIGLPDLRCYKTNQSGSHVGEVASLDWWLY